MPPPDLYFAYISSIDSAAPGPAAAGGPAAWLGGEIKAGMAAPPPPPPPPPPLLGQVSTCAVQVEHVWGEERGEQRKNEKKV